MNIDHRHKVKPKILENARELRKSPTPFESKLWSKLKGGQLLGYKFRRQHPVGSYILDFFCANCNLIIEIDGESHNYNIEYDQRRTKWLVDSGYTLIRFSNKDIIDDFDNVLNQILATCHKISPNPDLL